MINLFKANEGFDISTYTGSSIPDEINSMLIEVEDNVYQDLVDHKLMWSNGELVNNPNYQQYQQEVQQAKQRSVKEQRIEELKHLLQETDYRAIKYAEGLYTEEEYAPYKEQRQAYRDEINSLEEELKKLDD